MFFLDFFFVFCGSCSRVVPIALLSGSACWFLLLAFCFCSLLSASLFLLLLFLLLAFCSLSLLLSAGCFWLDAVLLSLSCFLSAFCFLLFAFYVLLFAFMCFGQKARTVATKLLLLLLLLLL